MTKQEYINEAESNLLHTYNRFNLVIEKGDGVYLYDTDGKKYLDFASGIAVFAFGYNNKEYNDALKEQIDKIIHTSNLFYNVPATEAAKKLTAISGMDRVFFTNIREETRKADKCGLIRVENRLYKLPEQYSNQSVFIQITDTEIIFHDADNKVIRIDKATSFYTAKLQEKSTIKIFNDVSPDYETWGQNSLSRSLDEYAKVTGGSW